MAERFDAIDQVRAVLGILEQSYVVCDVAARCARPGRVSLDRLRARRHRVPGECSLVVAPYESDGVALGTIGVLGPDPDEL